MNPPPRLGPALDERLDGLAPVPPELYLAAGRAAASRRRRGRVGLAAGLVAATVAVAGWALPLGGGADLARERRPAVATQAPEPTASLSSLVVEPGFGSIDAFTTDEIPEWATEYGNHGPAAIAPDGRLWIAPEATVVRSIEDPLGRPGTPSYAVETTGWVDSEGTFGADTPVWSMLYQEAGVPGSFGSLDEAGRWTEDFGAWVDDAVAQERQRPRLAERLASFAGETSEALVPGAGAEIVEQREDADIGDRPLRMRQSVAEVRIDGQTWFVLAVGKRDTVEYYQAWDAASAGASDLDGFLAFLQSGAS